MFRIPFFIFGLVISFLVSQVQDSPSRMVFFGDSITAGYGIPIEKAFPALIQAKLEQANKPFEVINAGLSGETTTGGLNRIDWILRSKPDVFVLELGGNDGLRGLSLNETEKNLKAMIEKVRKANPEAKIILAGMQIPPNLGQDYTERFQNLYPMVAQDMDVMLIPFLLEGVGGDPDLNLSDGIHPNEEGHSLVAELVWDVLNEVMDW